MGIFRSASGMVRGKLTSADPISTLAYIEKEGISVFDMEKHSPLEYSFRLQRSHAKKLRKLVEARGDRLRILPDSSLYWTVKGLQKRPVLVLGMVLLLAFTLWVPSRVFFVRVEGNSRIPAEQILQQAQLCGIDFGVARREVRSEKIKNSLLNAMPQLQWAGVNTYGCVAVITVRERTDPEKEEKPSGVSSIVATRDGVIGEMTVIRGSALCKPGQAVTAGQVLVSGYTDCGIYIRAESAQAEVFAQTKRQLQLIFPTQYTARQKKTGSQKKYSLIIGKKRINFAKDSGILGSTCAKIEMKYKLMLPGGFSLPVCLVVEQIISYETALQTQDHAESCLQQFAADYLQRQMIAGSVRNAAAVFTQLEGICRMDGVYDCYEMIGMTRPEDIINGKND